MKISRQNRVLRATRCEKIDRTPWVPFIGCHAGALIGKTATEYLQNEDFMVKGIQTAIDKYNPDGIPITFDLQLEAETFGCELSWADDNPPAVASHPLIDGKNLSDLKIPLPEDGRIGIVMNTCRRIRKQNPDIALYGLITGPFTLALHLLGTKIFMDMFDAPDDVEKILDFCRQTGEAISKYYIDAGADIIAVVDPMTSQIGPEQFHEFVTPHAKKLFEYIRTSKKLSSFFVCGHAQQNIEEMCKCRPDNICVDENIPLDYVRDISLPMQVSFGGNIPLTSVLLLGSETDSQKSALSCMERSGKEGFILAPGCDLPYATPQKNLEAIGKMIDDVYQQDVVKAMTDEANVCDTLNMTEYGQSDRVIIDIITLDSEACAPCQYMVEAVKAITPEFQGVVEWREHKIKHQQSLVFMTSLMVKNVPTICIDGRITFVSRIPKRDEMIAAIQKRIIEKMRTKIQRRKATLIILRKRDDELFQKTRENVDLAIKELGSEVEVLIKDDDNSFYAYGLSPLQSPAVVMAKYNVKSARKVPDVNIIKEWIKGI